MAAEDTLSSAGGPTFAEIRAWMLERLAEVLEIEAGAIDADKSFASFGISSMAAVTLTGDLDEWLELPLPATLAWDYPSVNLLARHLASLSGAEPAPVAPLSAAVEAIAIVGMGCRFPGSHGPTAYWEFLQAGRSAVQEVPPERWDVDAYYDATLEDLGCMNTRSGSFLADADLFDPGFFGISKREADAMDPQQRLLLEVSYEALEDAGVPLELIAGSETGVFMAITGSDYYKLMNVAPGRAGTGVANCIGANRVSYLFDLQGPSIAIDTACSSSLVAIHQACQSLRAGECPVALAGAVNLTLVPEVTVALAQSAMMAPDGRCKTFDASADGYVRGEGCGVVVLKRLVDAQRDGDHVWAVIRGSAVNQDGRSNGLTAPNGLAQQRVIRRALAAAGLGPAELGYVETHGSGTPLGDPIEVNALATVLAEGRVAGRPPCYLGAVKTNFGHLETAAGMAGLIKAVLALRAGEIPPNLHFTALNPKISLDPTLLALALMHTPWPARPGPRRAGVSSFGFGGTNAHVILEQAPAVVAGPEPAARPVVLALSAKTAPALCELAERFVGYLADVPTLAGVCRAAATRRSHFARRVAFAATTPQALVTSLQAFLAENPDAGTFCGVADERPRVAFLCADAGALDGEGVRALYTQEPSFRAVIDSCEATLLAPLTAQLFGASTTPPSAPARFAFGMALAAVWRARGVTPDWLAGQGVGEYVAACSAGVFELADGLRLVAALGTPEALRAAASQVSYKAPALPLVSGLTGALWPPNTGPDAAYWTTARVAVATCPDAHVCLGLGPAAAGNLPCATPQQLAAATAALYAHGATLDWEGVPWGAPPATSLPGYPFQRKRCWLGAGEIGFPSRTRGVPVA